MKIAEIPHIRQRVSLARHTTLDIGGPADFFLTVNTTKQLTQAVFAAEADGLPFFILGGGSNVLFPDEGFRGLVIRNHSRGIRVNHDQIIAESGALITRLTRVAAQHALSGIETWVTLPGTVGGAIRGNAGCTNVEVKDVLISAKVAYRESIQEVMTEYFSFDYRESSIKSKPAVVLEATFQLRTDEESNIRARMDKSRAQRLAKQPTGRTAGSFFKNPQDDFAGRLIEAVGYKGKRIGGIRVSNHHANFIINDGTGKASDVLALMQDIQEKVLDTFGITLEPEVCIVDFQKQR